MTMRFSKAMAIGAFFLCAGHAHAASSYLFDNPENRAFLGVRVGLDISSAANGGGYYSNKAGSRPGRSIISLFGVTFISNRVCRFSTIRSEQHRGILTRFPSRLSAMGSLLWGLTVSP